MKTVKVQSIKRGCCFYYVDIHDDIYKMRVSSISRKYRRVWFYDYEGEYWWLPFDALVYLPD